MKFECQNIFCKKEVVGASSSMEPIIQEISLLCRPRKSE